MLHQLNFMVLINYCEVLRAEWNLSEPIKNNDILKGVLGVRALCTHMKAGTWWPEANVRCFSSSFPTVFVQCVCRYVCNACGGQRAFSGAFLLRHHHPYFTR